MSADIQKSIIEENKYLFNEPLKEKDEYDRAYDKGKLKKVKKKKKKI